MSIRIFDNPKGGVEGGPNYNNMTVTGTPAQYVSQAAYTTRLQINNYQGDCTVQLLTGTLPNGYTLTVDNTTHEVVIAWPDYRLTANAAPVSPNLDFESGDMHWIKGAGWRVETTAFTIDGVYNGNYKHQGGQSLILNDTPLPCPVGRLVTFSCRVHQGGSNAGNAGAAALIQFLDASGNVLSTVEGKLIDHATYGTVRTSSGSGTAPTGTATVRIGARGFRKAQDLSLQVDTFVWDAGEVVASVTVGTNGTAAIPLSLRVTDSVNRTADWSGTITRVPGYADLVLADAPVIWLKLNETGGSAALDYSGNARNGTYYGAYLPAAGIAPSGASSGSVKFTATSGRVEVPQAGALQVGSDGTWALECTLYLDSTTGGSVGKFLIANWGSEQFGYLNYWLSLRTGSSAMTPQGGYTTSGAAACSVVNGAALTVATAYHLMVCKDATGERLYINGVKTAESNTACAMSLSPAWPGGADGFTIGANNYPSSYGFVGRIENVAVYPAIVSDANILARAVALGF